MSYSSQVSLRFNERAQISDFVNDLYQIFHERAPDPSGHDTYVNLLKDGTGVAEIISAFVGSDEFIDRIRRRTLLEILTRAQRPARDGEPEPEPVVSGVFPEDYDPPGEAGRSYLERVRSGFFDRYCSGPLVLDIGYAGYDNPGKKAALPNALGIDLDYPGYDGVTLPFEDGTVDTVFSSHCLEHILWDHATIQDWRRVLKVGGFIVCIVPSQALYEKKRFLPSRFNADHKRMYTPANLLRSFEEALTPNTYRVRHLAENDRNFNYTLGPDVHSDGAYEIELVVEKIQPPDWNLS